LIKVVGLKKCLKKGGQPTLASQMLASGEKAQISISHDGDYAIAVVLIEEG